MHSCSAEPAELDNDDAADDGDDEPSDVDDGGNDVEGLPEEDEEDDIVDKVPVMFSSTLKPLVEVCILTASQKLLQR